MAEPTKSIPSRRHIFIVDRTFQVKYSVGFAALGALAAAGAALAVFLVLPAAPPFDGSAAFLLGVCALMGGLASGGACVLLTYRVAGPVFVMSRALCDLAEGRVPRLRALRTGDELGEFYELFARSIDLLHARERERHARLQQIAAALGQGTDAERVAQAASLLRQLVEAEERRD